MPSPTRKARCHPRMKRNGMNGPSGKKMYRYSVFALRSFTAPSATFEDDRAKGYSAQTFLCNSYAKKQALPAPNTRLSSLLPSFYTVLRRGKITQFLCNKKAGSACTEYPPILSCSQLGHGKRRGEITQFPMRQKRNAGKTCISFFVRSD